MSQAKASVAVISATAIAFTFAHGALVNADLNNLPANIQAQLALYGLRQKLQDSYSGKKESQECEAALTAALERLTSGEWTAARTPSQPANQKLVQAIVNLTGKSAEEISAVVDTLDEAQIKTYKAQPAIKAELARMLAEELAAKAKASGDSLAALLGGATA